MPVTANHVNSRWIVMLSEAKHLSYEVEILRCRAALNDTAQNGLLERRLKTGNMFQAPAHARWAVTAMGQSRLLFKALVPWKATYVPHTYLRPHLAYHSSTVEPRTTHRERDPLDASVAQQPRLLVDFFGFHDPTSL